MSVLRFGLIGCSSIARKAFIPSIDTVKNAKVTVAASRSLEKAEEFAGLIDGKAVTGYDNLLERDDIDAVYISTPLSQHAEWAIKAANAGKHVLCEKTMAMDVQQTQEILEAVKKNRVTLLEGFAYRFHSQHQYLKEAVKEGKIGEPFHLQAWFGIPPRPDNDIRYKKNLGGGALMDVGTYPVHVARFFFGEEPENIHATMSSSETHEVEIRGAAQFNFSGGKTAHLAFGMNNFYRNMYTVWGSEGSISLTRAFSIPPTHTPELILEQQANHEVIPLQPDDPFGRMIEAFVAEVEGKSLQSEWNLDALYHAKALEEIRNQTGW
ncbi:Gfo/Idh/MocA family oxidoreductase [bacterium]|nr:Gfo/Idh/MocA family oxidoreductase [bacterium]